MKTIVEGILSSNKAGLTEIIKKFRDRLPYEDHKYYDFSEADKGKVHYIGKVLTIDKDVVPFESFIDFPNLKTLILNYSSPNSIPFSKMPPVLKNIVIRKWKNGTLEGLPACQNLEIDESNWLIKIDISNFASASNKIKTLYIHNSKKLANIANLYDLVEDEIVVENCEKFTLDGCPEVLNCDLQVLNCSGLTSLKGMSPEINGDVIIRGNKNLASLDGISSKIKGSLVFRLNGIEPKKSELIAMCNTRKVTIR